MNIGQICSINFNDIVVTFVLGVLTGCMFYYLALKAFRNI